MLNVAYSKYMYYTLAVNILQKIKFRGNVEIPRKRANSAARLKFVRSAENCGS